MAHAGRFSLYLITDRKLARGGGVVEACAQALSAARETAPDIGVAVQLREKDLTGRELYALGREFRAVCSRFGALLTVNDRIDVALACEADGIHLPADSFSPAEARRMLGPARLIGVSAHSVSDLEHAEREGADFAVYGPVYAPLSKAGSGAACGVDGLAEGCRATRLPVFALGGITVERTRELRASGAAGVAVIGAVFGADSPADATRALLRAIRDNL